MTSIRRARRNAQHKQATGNWIDGKPPVRWVRMPTDSERASSPGHPRSVVYARPDRLRREMQDWFKRHAV